MRATRSPGVRPRVALPLLLSLGLTGCGLIDIGFGPKASREWQQSYDLSEQGSVEVININGRIEAQPSADDRVEVRAEITARGASERAARERLEHIQIEEDTGSDHVRLETKLPVTSFFTGGGSEVRYFLRIPAGRSVRLRTTNGSISVTGLQGELKAKTVNGSVSGSGLAGAVEASTTNGSIKIEVERVAEAGIDLQTVNGSIRLRIPATAAADLSAHLTNGSIDTSDLPLQDLRRSSRRRLEAKLGSGGPPIELRTVNGSIRIAGSEDSSSEVPAESP